MSFTGMWHFLCDWFAVFYYLCWISSVHQASCSYNYDRTISELAKPSLAELEPNPNYKVGQTEPNPNCDSAELEPNPNYNKDRTEPSLLGSIPISMRDLLPHRWWWAYGL